MITRRILLIENENVIRELTQLCLETEAGWEVLTTASSYEAIVKTETERLDAILMDVDAFICEQDLSVILQRLQSNPVTYHIPVILLTTLANVEISQMVKLGVRAAIAKPFDLMTLAQQVAEVLNWKY
ncbi:MAG: response regulator [Chlorogloeopsis fritschii C42_A2020_084]|uniref:response regulator n=1 Tax=Chlorogloeopsis fritschii TaxID=1124 RepID=UPI001A0A5930|nr:response regulator [Chlorogloeopsis fritschii]MBF2007094.1 response regulator [Chlorogloeopsis fritschii C42_A2020_084]